MCRFHGMLLLSAKCPRPSGQTGRHLVKDDSENHLKGTDIPFGAMINIIRFLHETCQGFTNLARKFCQAYSSDMHLIAGGIWKGDILIADIEGLEKMDASEIYLRRNNAKEVLIPQKGEEFIFPAETTNSENPLQGGNNLSGVKISVENFKANRESLNRKKQRMTLKPLAIWWQTSRRLEICTRQRSTLEGSMQRK